VNSLSNSEGSNKFRRRNTYEENNANRAAPSEYISNSQFFIPASYPNDPSFMKLVDIQSADSKVIHRGGDSSKDNGVTFSNGHFAP
jgi:hypothetical protein